MDLIQSIDISVLRFIRAMAQKRTMLHWLSLDLARFTEILS